MRIVFGRVVLVLFEGDENITTIFRLWRDSMDDGGLDLDIALA